MPAVRGTQRTFEKAGTVGGDNHLGSGSVQESTEGRNSNPLRSEGRCDPYTIVDRSSEPTVGVGPSEQNGTMEVDVGSQLLTHAANLNAAATSATTGAAAVSKQQSKEQSGASSTTTCSAELGAGLGPLNTDRLQAPGDHTSGRKRTIGGKTTKWAVSTQKAKAYMSACYLCAKQFMDNEPRLLQWGDRNSCQRYVHGHCVHGGISAEHEFVPKGTDDTKTVDKHTQHLQHTEP